nr:hypothetical protein BaRGS_004697 [Batillaria attramentaria]
MLQEGVTHECKLCTLVFDSPAKLQCHLIEHTFKHEAEMRYECRECCKVFTSATALANHRKTHERRETSIKCTLCTQTFTNVPLMQQHFLTAHAGITVDSGHGDTSSKSHKCSQCKQQFATQDGLQAHMKTHKTGV